MFYVCLFFNFLFKFFVYTFPDFSVVMMFFFSSIASIQYFFVNVYDKRTRWMKKRKQQMLLITIRICLPCNFLFCMYILYKWASAVTCSETTKQTQKYIK